MSFDVSSGIKISTLMKMKDDVVNQVMSYSFNLFLFSVFYLGIFNPFLFYFVGPFKSLCTYFN